MMVSGHFNLINMSLEGMIKLLLRSDGENRLALMASRLFFLKGYEKILAASFVIIFDVSIKTSAVPDDWLIAHVIPAFRKGSRLLVSNYRPIPLTCICYNYFNIFL